MSHIIFHIAVVAHWSTIDLPGGIVCVEHAEVDLAEFSGELAYFHWSILFLHHEFNHF